MKDKVGPTGTTCNCVSSYLTMKTFTATFQNLPGQLFWPVLTLKNTGWGNPRNIIFIFNYMPQEKGRTLQGFTN